LSLLFAREVFAAIKTVRSGPNLGRQDEAADLDDKVEVFDSEYGVIETNRRPVWITVSDA
jgi:hypothetical protein